MVAVQRLGLLQQFKQLTRGRQEAFVTIPSKFLYEGLLPRDEFFAYVDVALHHLKWRPDRHFYKAELSPPPLRTSPLFAAPSSF